MGDVRCRPHAHGEQITGSRTDAIDQAAEEEEADAIGGLEPEDDVAVAAFRPAVELLQRRLEDAENEPVDVAQDDRREEQAANDPAQACSAPGRGG